MSYPPFDVAAWEQMQINKKGKREETTIKTIVFKRFS
jgi:hypothetical protein